MEENLSKLLFKKNIAVRLISAAADKSSSPVPATKTKLQRNLELFCFVHERDARASWEIEQSIFSFTKSSPIQKNFPLSLLPKSVIVTVMPSYSRYLVGFEVAVGLTFSSRISITLFFKSSYFKLSLKPMLNVECVSPFVRQSKYFTPPCSTEIGEYSV
ncbi:hypothetical protein Flavo103_08420 [Flavobacterium collinsii]|nr:hypothetical protein Flavo103_08420 [Flavobacterium collinsii]